MTYSTRETWLNAALALTRSHLADTAGVTVPDAVRVSCGFPGGGSARKRIGECWNPAASSDQTAEIFISPVLGTAADVLHVLVHEAIHAALPEAGHTAPFRKAALAAGLTGKMTATTATPELAAKLEGWAPLLGEYPHARLNLGMRKKQGTRLVKCECADCGYTVRTAAKWLAVGEPTCPCGGTLAEWQPDVEERAELES